jgi:hypothetical protein
MTFDQAFDRAACVAKAVTVEAAPRTWWQRLGLAARDRWAPTPAERVKAVEAIRSFCRDFYEQKGRLPTDWEVRRECYSPVGFGPLTWLWIAVMVAQLLAALKHLLNEREAS